MLFLLSSFRLLSSALTPLPEFLDFTKKQRHYRIGNGVSILSGNPATLFEVQHTAIST